MKEKKIAIIGCGAVTRLNYLPHFSRVPNTKISYVHDVNVQSAEYAANILSAKVASSDEIRDEADAVIIATPPVSHYQLAEYYLQHVPIVVCEKPFVGTAEEAKSLIRIAKEKKAKLYVAHFRRMFPTVQLARSIVSSGIIGEIRSLEIFEGGRFSWQADSNYIMKDPFGGVLFDTGSHSIDMAMFAAGMDSSVFSMKVDKIMRERPEPSHSIRGEFSFSTDNTTGRCFVSFSRYQVLPNLLRIIGSNGSVELSTGLDDRLILKGKKGSVVIGTEEKISNLLDCFFLQFQHIFNEGNDEIFLASRFVNLTTVLEHLSQKSAGI